MRRKAVLGLVTALVLSAAGCGFGQADPAGQASSAASDPAGPATSAASDPASTAPSGATPADPTPADPSQPAGPDQLGQPVVTRTSAVDGEKVTLALYPVVRDGQVSHVNLTLSVAEEDAGRMQVSDLLADGDYSAGDGTGDTADGLQLVDGKNAKLYLVATAGKERCVCSRSLSGLFLHYGKPVLLSATFAAPPPGVTAVEVRIPNFGTVKNVPVQ